MIRGVFFIKIIVPAILVIVLFVVSFSLIFLPMVEKGFMDRKREMIRELTNSVWSIIDEYHQESRRGNLTEEMAREMVINRVRSIRYGDESKDYFWITNMKPEMIMHPYRTELNGMDISTYTDPQGTMLFAESVKKVSISGEGYIDYWWQWKDDSTRIVPKLSYVKGYEPWGWIVGTGIYIEDVKEEMKIIRGRLVRITLLFILLISVIIFYITRQSLIIERRRIDAEKKLKQSRSKYKMLVEASAESTMMWLDGKLVYFNQSIIDQTGYSREELLEKKMDELFILQNDSIQNLSKAIDQSRNTEATLLTRGGRKVEVVLTISNIEINKKHGYIFIMKEVTRQLIRDKSEQMFQHELNTSLQLMNLPVKQLIRQPVNIDMDLTIHEAAEMMTRKHTELLFVTRNGREVVGLLHNEALIAQALAGKKNYDTRIFEVMRSPVTYVKENLLLFEALLVMDKENTDYLVIKNHQLQPAGFVSKKGLLEAQQNVSLSLIRNIEKAELVTQLQSLYDKLPGILSLLLGTGSNYRNIEHISTAVSDAIAKRVVELAIERTGTPPVRFAFISLGSEGRQEQTLKTDQDNAIIYHGEKSQEADEYFHELSSKINSWLNDIGYKFCIGKIMASNPRWCQPVSKWKEYFRKWVENSDPESIMDTSIFFDLRHVYGDNSLVEELKKEISNITDSQAVFFTHLAQSVHRFKAVTFSEKQDTIDLKKAIMPLVGFARVYALKNKVNETNTLLRLNSIISLEKINKPFINEIIKAYEYLMLLRFRSQTAKILSNESPDNILRIDELASIEKTTLKAVLSEITEIYTQLSFDFEGAI
jgi:PAS domain S-box-containing protein